MQGTQRAFRYISGEKANFRFIKCALSTPRQQNVSLQLTERISKIQNAMITAVEESGGAHSGLECTIVEKFTLHLVNKFVNSRWGCSLRLIRIDSQISIANYKAAAKQIQIPSFIVSHAQSATAMHILRSIAWGCGLRNCSCITGMRSKHTDFVKRWQQFLTASIGSKSTQSCYSRFRKSTSNPPYIHYLIHDKSLAQGVRQEQN